MPSDPIAIPHPVVQRPSDDLDHSKVACIRTNQEPRGPRDCPHRLILLLLGKYKKPIITLI